MRRTLRKGVLQSLLRTIMGDISAMQSQRSPQKSPIFDLSHPLINGKVMACDGHPRYNACCISRISEGAMFNVHSLSLATHTGTHIDAPYHIFDNGIKVDEIDLSLLTAVPAVVADLRSKGRREKITWDDLEKYEGQMRCAVALLLCTGWSRNWGKRDYDQHPFLNAAAAARILATGIKVIGVETMSPDEVTEEEGDVGHVHRQVLGNGGLIIENLNGLENILDSGLADEDLRISALPLKLGACDGSPIRAVAWSKRNVA